MDNQQFGLSPYTVNLPRTALKQMIAIVRGLQNLSENPLYQDKLEGVQLNTLVDSKHYSVLMGYDFHLSESQQVKLIEVNTNAGGLWFAYRCYNPNAQQLPEKLANKLVNTFLKEYALFCNKQKAKPQLIAIVDEQPSQQFLYPEMQMFAGLFQRIGIDVVIIDPAEIEAKEAGLYFQGRRIDLIYNRHCDFYLKSDEMRVVDNAWKKQLVCLTPNPRVYGLLADKQRMVDWSNSEVLNELLPPKLARYVKEAVPQTQLLSSFAKDSLWAERKKWVFKPANGYASRGVYVGNKLTKNKFNSLDPQQTLVQRYIKPSVVAVSDEIKFKTDFRLFVYRKETLAVSARLYQGQVTNLRTKNGGFCRVNVQ